MKKSMKKIVSILLAAIMLFSISLMPSYAEDETTTNIDQNIAAGFTSIVEYLIPGMSSGLYSFLDILYKIAVTLFPNLVGDKVAAVENFKVDSGFDKGDDFKFSFTLTGSELPFKSLRTELATVFEFRTQNADGSWTDWKQISNSWGFPVVLTRFSTGYLKNVETGETYNGNLFKPDTIPENARLSTSISMGELKTVNDLSAGTTYAIRVTLSINNSNKTTTFTSGSYVYTK